MQLNRPALFSVQLAMLAAAGAAAVTVSRSSDWRPLGLVGLLLVIALLADLNAARARALRISGCFPVLVLAMALLGPAPAAVIGAAAMLVDAARTRPPLLYAINNVATFATFPVAGGLLIRGGVQSMGIDPHELAFLALVFTVFIVTNALNFTLVVGSRTLADGFSLRDAFRTLFLPVLPSQLAAALLTGVIAVSYNQIGFVALALLGGVLVIFQYLLRELLTSRERGEELQRRSTQLASLQMGVLAVMVQTLSLRDHMTARHSAAVARYARELARALGCSEAEQDLVHTAGLLHDIGKFIFPDDILFAERPLTEDDWRCVRRHPTQGSLVVRQVDGYGPVADLVLCHHEHYDGSGYPRALVGREIPRLARVLAVADTYDVITARDSYQQPRHPIQAIAELRAVSGTQLDPEAVEAFVALLESRGVAFQHGDDADFEAELAFSARVRAYAEPRREVGVAS